MAALHINTRDRRADDFGALFLCHFCLRRNECAWADMAGGLRLPDAGAIVWQGQVGIELAHFARADHRGIPAVLACQSDGWPDVGIFRAYNLQETGRGEESDPALGLDFRIPDDGAGGGDRPVRFRIVNPRQASFVVVTAEHAVMRLSVGRLIGANDGDAVLPGGKMTCCGRSDQAAAHDNMAVHGYLSGTMTAGILVLFTHRFQCGK